MNETNGDIRDSFRRATFDKFAEVFIGHVRLTAEPANIPRLFGILIPQFQVPHTEIILVIFEQLFQAGSPNVYKFYLRFLGSTGSFRTLQNILFARSRRLDHLIDRPITHSEKFVTESEDRKSTRLNSSH